MNTLSTRRRLLAVFAGGFCGALARALLSVLIQSHLGSGWPYDILLINLSGALLLAFCTVLADATTLLAPTRRLFVNVGFIGAYTTFSSLAMGDVLLLAHGDWLPAFLYLILSIVGGCIVILLGDWLGQLFLQRVRHRAHKVASRPLTRPLSDQSGVVDIDDDLLLPEQDARRWRQ
ncbi:fluoride efflux transporter FluC [Ktedonospora formicarum]|uniref:Fluoride-specific ion channel FluC n=1 Tax=Ktedonospora formicarum TaxID=2778364 RepID=A0A8J3HXL1_9CHLR|nr:CrcB family protein [Ktedonospora formicarum]GHO46037.1 hypothetical protein KSX_42000 [Ktedonospora formicarum]